MLYNNIMYNCINICLKINIKYVIVTIYVLLNDVIRDSQVLQYNICIINY